METRDTGHPFKKFNRSEVNSVAKMFKKIMRAVLKVQDTNSKLNGDGKVSLLKAMNSVSIPGLRGAQSRGQQALQKRLLLEQTLNL